MTLKQNEYNESYFGDPNSPLKHKAGYSNYLELQTNWVQRERIKKFLIRHNIPKNSKILELGAAVGFMGKIATEEGYKNWTCVDFSLWCKKNELSPIIEQDALSYLQSQPDNSFDVIVSFALLECLSNPSLVTLYQQMRRVGIKQIHQTFEESNSKFYNIKTLADWKSLLSQDTVIEFYG